MAKSKTRCKRSSKAERKSSEPFPGYAFEQPRAERVCRFLETFVTMTEGARWAGRPMRLMPWQRECIEQIYGWADAEGKRRVRRAAIFVPKKCGKSGLMAGLAIYHLLADNEPGAFVALAACDRHQAGIIFRAIAASVRASPELSRVLEIIDSRSTVIHKATNSRIVAMSADSWRAEGINASAVIVDELHAHRKPDLVRALLYAGASRAQPLCIAISTAGDDRNSIGYEWWKDCELVQKDPRAIPTFFGRIYRAEDGDDFADPKVWEKANPSWGVTIDPKAFKAEYEDAATSPAKLAVFLRYRLNVWSDLDVRLFDAARWEACNAEPIDFAGRPVWIGVDLASNIDMTAAAILCKDDEGVWNVRMRYWVPSESIHERERTTGLPYQQWVREGHLSVTDGGRLDHERVAADLIEISRQCQVIGVGADPWQLGPLATFLQREGLEVTAIRQNTATLSAPCKYVEGIVAERRLRHGGHPILTMNANNTVCYTDPTGMIKPDKSKGRMIDGMVAVINGMALASVAEQAAAAWDLVTL